MRSYASTRHETFETLVSPHLALLKRWVSNRAPKSLHSDDIIQQTLLLAFRNIESLRLEASMGRWLCAIAVNVIRVRQRSPEYSRLVYYDSLEAEFFCVKDSSQSPLEALEQKESFTQLHRVISMLPERYRVVVELRDLKQCSTEEIMKTLSLSRTAIKSRHFRARRMLFKLLNSQRSLTNIRCRALAESLAAR